MPILVLVLNSGSSTLKYRVVDTVAPADGNRGIVERIGQPGSVPDHAAALAEVFAQIPAATQLSAVGHRVVHGGSRFTGPTVIDDDVVRTLKDLVPLAPLHNPGAIAGIEASRARRPDLPQVAVFDTSFHLTLSPVAATYAIDRSLATELGIRRYGFHGTSHRYVSERTADLLGRPLADLNLIVLHLGNGASATAVAGGRSVATSMGFTPLEGLVMGTRGGDIDPGVLLHMQRTLQFSTAQLDDLLNHHSGLSGLCGDIDMRAVLDRRDAGDPDAALAVDVYCHRIRTYVGAYHAVLGRLDAITFTAGVGENAAAVRAESVSGLQMWGIAIDPDRNKGDGARIISPDDSRVTVCVIPTDEELAIAGEVAGLFSSVVSEDGP
jgi:acetate kinase